MHRANGILLSGLALAGIISACAVSHEPIAFEQPDGSTPPPPTFTPSGDDAGDASPDVTKTPLLCIATECPAPFDTCGAGYRCSTNLSNDSNNCGACGKVCPDSFGYLNLTSTCVNGTCETACTKKLAGGKFWNYADCNSVFEDGCEINISTDPNNCGTCGNKCADGVECIDGKCGLPPGQAECWGMIVDLQNDDFNCGECDNYCEPPPDAPELANNMVYGCVKGQCGQPKCADWGAEKWVDCDKDPKNGCEVYIGPSNDPSLIDPNNCGACGKKCTGDQICDHRQLAPHASCTCENPQETRCGSSATYDLGCFDLLNDPNNCGTCFNKCTTFGRNTAATCRKGDCENSCLPGWGDCDGNPKNGCETNLMVSDGHCGACGNRCDTQAGQPCVEGQCAMKECDAGIEVPQ
ncbi:hypothetical protein AKJ09_05074 [Labilithrix luteola]|uniref:Tryptophan synthase alpha chain n=1 Tax=Labilithrix luteola TaxID=1391654 RepID=A0A0K1PY03_9BACT|nr:hypothetical protein [Labilithrix luteola]AKU98410.1 hypothetical protein AKJ09_05074 [Labilithrix luteola]